MSTALNLLDPEQPHSLRYLNTHIVSSLQLFYRFFSRLFEEHKEVSLPGCYRRETMVLRPDPSLNSSRAAPSASPRRES